MMAEQYLLLNCNVVPLVVLNQLVEMGDTTVAQGTVS
jgi:hypothetical protein